MQQPASQQAFEHANSPANPMQWSEIISQLRIRGQASVLIFLFLPCFIPALPLSSALTSITPASPTIPVLRIQ